MSAKSAKPKTAKKPAASSKSKGSKGSKSTWLRYLKRLGITIVVLYAAVCLGMYLFQTQIIFHPSVADSSTQWDLSLKEGRALEKSVEELTLDAALGGRVNAMHFHAPAPSKGVVLFLHGNGGNIQSYLARRTAILKRGYDFFLIDYRGYGKSTGPVSEAGLDADVEAAYQYLAKKYAPEQMIFYGHSLGTGFAVRLAKKHAPRSLCLEAPYTSLADVGVHRFPFLPVRLLTKYPGESLTYIDDLRCPINVIHGTADETIPYEMGQQMVAEARNGKLYTCPDVGHNGCPQTVQFAQMLDKVLY